VETSDVVPRPKTPVEVSTDLLASFFGVEQEAIVEEEEQASEIVSLQPRTITPTAVVSTTGPTLITPPSIMRNTTKSSPIAFGAASAAKQQQHSSLHHNYPVAIHRRDSAPSPGTPSPPADFIDEKDGHIWRSKYCVLEEGILYFYRNAEDGESVEAQAERLRKFPGSNGGSSSTSSSTIEQDGRDLSKSPLPRKFLSADTNLNVIWEKRVALSCVGGVRSAEFRYGDFAFELLAENGDPLILKANNAQDLHEWLFQFHRSLASFMKNFMDAMGRWSQTHAVDLHRPSVMPAGSADDAGGSLTYSPRFRKPYLGTSLSHGHGRSGMHRRRADEKETESPAGGSSPVQFSIEPVKAVRVTPRPTKKQALAIGAGTISLLANQQQQEREPEIASSNCPPEMERPIPSVTPKKYVPPHLRGKTVAGPKKTRYVPPHLRSKAKEEGSNFMTLSTRVDTEVVPSSIDRPAESIESAAMEETPKRLPQILASGGCADPRLVNGSIMDPAFKKRNSSRVEKTAPDSYGCYGGGLEFSDESSLRWEVGAMSEKGIRNSNEDAFLICSSASKAFGTLPNYVEQDASHWGKHDPGFFGIFDGHCGNEAARFSVERLNAYFHKEWDKSNMSSVHVKDALQQALENLDHDFCKVCVEDGRAWESGTTAIVAVIVDEVLVVSNIGDCRAVVCRSTEANSGHEVDSALHVDGWSQLEDEEDLSALWTRATSKANSDDNEDILRDWFWKEMADVHSPSRPDEQQRIQSANGWITTEQEIPFDQLQRMDFCDEDVVEILKRCFSDRYNRSQPLSSQKKYSASPQRIVQISRVCGELAVSRAIGDRDFKSNFNQHDSKSAMDEVPRGTSWWDCPLLLPYPKNHTRQFKGDLVSSIAESRTMKISQEGLIDEFLVLACDGLWDVMDPDDAVRVTRGLLFEKKWPARKAAARLAELAIHLGSSDNITVIVMRFFRSTS
jgi:serine/threonine protein phosphatase PrpC